MLQAVAYLHSVVGLNSGQPKANPILSNQSEEMRAFPQTDQQALHSTQETLTICVVWLRLEESLLLPLRFLEFWTLLMIDI